MTDPIADALGIPAKATEPTGPIAGVVTVPDTNIEADFQFARDQLYELNNKGMEALSDLVTLANQSQDYHMYDSIAKLVEVIGKTNVRLTDIATRDPKAKDGYGEAPKTVTNNNLIFSDKPAMTSADKIKEILSMVEEGRKTIDGNTS